MKAEKTSAAEDLLMNKDLQSEEPSQFRLNRATLADSAAVWQWRNDPQTKLMSITPGETSWEVHNKWYQAALASPDCYMYIGCISGTEKIGVCRFDVTAEKNAAEVSINLNPEYRGRGFSKKLLAASIRDFIRHHKKDLLAKIKKINLVSIKCFSDCGFVFEKEDAEFMTYRKKICRLSFKFIANACGVFTGKNGTKILCDPWLVDGVFDGSWCHFPKITTTINDVKNIDAIYISHLHPDHFDDRNFDFEKSTPLIVMDHGPNFLIKKLTALGFTNLIKIKSEETISYNEFELTMFAPFAKHNFHEAAVGNLIDSALLVTCDGITALNANDNTLTVEAASMLREKFGPITLAMLNYNAAGPYPSCFDNLSEDEKTLEHGRVLERNFNHSKKIIDRMRPKFILPFAGSYVLGGDMHFKNKYLGTATWDEFGAWLAANNIGPTKIVLLRENDTLDVEHGVADKAYEPIDVMEMKRYIEAELSHVRYPYQLDPMPDENCLVEDVKKAAGGMKDRMARFRITSSFSVVLKVYANRYLIYPEFKALLPNDDTGDTLECSLDERLLRNILDKKSHWNNAEIGAHISFNRSPNRYEPDLHTALQFFHV
jgi:UDP-MurNAc hydroxylase